MRKFLLAGLAALTLAGPALADDRGDRRGWHDDRREWHQDRRDWRHDRHDWRDDRRGWRDDRRDWRWSGARYRGPVYAYPRGLGYRAWNVGYRLPPAYFGNRYWIGDPGAYRLPPAWRGTRWVRVGPDALLIQIGNGVVIRAVRGLLLVAGRMHVDPLAGDRAAGGQENHMMRNLVLTLAAAASVLATPATAQPRPDRPGYDRPGPNRPIIVRPGPNGHRPGYWNGRAYYDPRGFGYRAWNIGQPLPRAYWGNRYWWVTGATDWRLPVVGPNRRWVRVGPDAVLVNIRNGRVIDVRRGVFW